MCSFALAKHICVCYNPLVARKERSQFDHGEVPKLAEGTPLERVQVVNSGAGVRIPPSPFSNETPQVWKKAAKPRIRGVFRVLRREMPHPVKCRKIPVLGKNMTRNMTRNTFAPLRAGRLFRGLHLKTRTKSSSPSPTLTLAFWPGRTSLLTPYW